MTVRKWGLWGILGLVLLCLGLVTVLALVNRNLPTQSSRINALSAAEKTRLATAVQAQTDIEAATLAQQFLKQRAQRRQVAGLNSTLTDYERQREWLEGLARYVELEIWRQAALNTTYQPVATLQDDPDFDRYATFNQRWTQEIDQIGRMANDAGDDRFYYSGMAQAILLDKLLPTWKSQALNDDIFLEDLLATAVATQE